LKEHERLYTPSEWTKRYKSGEEQLAQFFKFCGEGKTDAQIFLRNHDSDKALRDLRRFFDITIIYYASQEGRVECIM